MPDGNQPSVWWAVFDDVPGRVILREAPRDADFLDTHKRSGLLAD